MVRRQMRSQAWFQAIAKLIGKIAGDKTTFGTNGVKARDGSGNLICRPCFDRLHRIGEQQRTARGVRCGVEQGEGGGPGVHGVVGGSLNVRKMAPNPGATGQGGKRGNKGPPCVPAQNQSQWANSRVQAKWRPPRDET